MRWLLVVLGLMLVVLIGFFLLSQNRQVNIEEDAPDDRQTQDGEDINSFQECVEAGFPVAESDPRQCTANGQTFTEEDEEDEDSIELIQVESPSANEEISSPLDVTGEARGPWYFEATFPIRLLDGNGNEIATGFATAQGDWMTEDFVPFDATLEFEIPNTNTGTLVLERANPSGLPENAQELRIPVTFSQQAQ